MKNIHTSLTDPKEVIQKHPRNLRKNSNYILYGTDQILGLPLSNAIGYDGDLLRKI